MLQAMQIMLTGAAIAVVVGFLVAFMIWILTRLLNLGGKETEAGREEETEAAVALAIAVACSRKNHGG